MSFKYNFKKIFLIFCFVVFTISAVCVSWVFSYDSNIAHPFLTKSAIELFNQNSGNRISTQEIKWIVQGAIEEDTPIRWMNHFYDPITNKGLFGFSTAKKWSKQNIKQALYAKGNQTWQKAIKSYAKGDKEEAFIALGHILHLIEDMSVPAHTRNDPHAFGDPFEEWVKYNSAKDFSEIQLVNFNNLDEYFDSLANYSNKYFLSKDSINKEELAKKERFFKKINEIEAIECIKISAESENFCLIVVRRKLRTDDYFIDDPIVHSDYYFLLAPKAISYSASVIELFFKEVGEGETDKPQTVFDKESSEIISETVEEVIEEVENVAVKVLSAVKEIDENLSPVITAEDLFKPKQAGAGEEYSAPALPLAMGGSDVGVSYVIDGDTIVLTTGEKVRYIGIDTPELGVSGPDDDECLAWVARLRNMQLLSSGELKLYKDPSDDKDKYGRLLRYVYIDNLFINEQLAREGLAEEFFCKPGWKNCAVVLDKNREQIIKRAVSEAEQYKRGIFSKACEQFEKENGKKQVIDENFVDVKKIEPKKQIHIFSGGSSNSSSETEDVVEVEPEETIVEKEVTPVIVLFELYDLISSSANITSSTTVGVNLDILNSENVNGYFLSISSTTPEIEDIGWTSGSPEKFVLSGEDGEKNVYFWLKYGENNVLASTSSNIILDTAFPAITFDHGPAIFSSSTLAVFKYSANKENIALQCKLDNEDWRACGTSSASTTISGLSEAEHNFYVKGIDLLGKISSSTYNWLIDLTAPIAATIAPVYEYEGNNFMVSWEGLDIASSTASLTKASGIDKFDIEYKIGDNDWINWMNATTSTSTIFNINVNTGQVIYFRSRAYDKAGNIGLSNEAETEIKSTITDHVVISEVKINSEEFIELYNPTDNDIDLSDYYFCYFSPDRDWDEPYRKRKFQDGAIIASHNYYLITTVQFRLANEDWSLEYKNYFLNNESGSVGIFSADPFGKTVEEAKQLKIDVVAWGNVEYVKEGESTPVPNAGQSIERKAAQNSTTDIMQGIGGHQWLGNSYDTDNNSEDFVIRNNPEPQNSKSLEEPWDEIQNFQGSIIYKGNFSDIGSTTGKWDLFYLDHYDRNKIKKWHKHTNDYPIFTDDAERSRLIVDGEEKLRIKYEEEKIQFEIDKYRLGIKVIYNGTEVSLSDNYILSFDAELNSGVDRNIIFRRQDSKNYYILALRGVWGSNFPAIILAKCKNGDCVGYNYRQYLWAYYFNSGNALNNEKAHIDIEVIDDSIRVFYNNRPVIEYDEQDTGYPTSGTFGFRVWSGDDGKIDVAFDNIVIRSIE